MQIQFTKMNGAGNDFVLIDNRGGQVSLSREQVARVCHRQRGVGADGLMLLKNADGEGDWAWDFFNSDGSDAEMCGNGARCFASYIQHMIGGEGALSFETVCGLIRAEVGDTDVMVNLTAPQGLALKETISTSDGDKAVHSLNTGVPHAVLFVEGADAAMVSNLGEEIRYHDHFAPAGTNVNFVQVLAEGHIRVRTYERGVGETLACGTGVSASAMITAHLNGWASPVAVDVLGGDTLRVAFDSDGDVFSNVHLTGPAVFVFEGTIAV